MKINFKLTELNHIVKVHILPLLEQKSIFTFTGPLGAGKTTMIKEILRQSGIIKNVSSPTFGYVNSYNTSEGITLNHFDLYRIHSVEELFDMGYEEYFFGDSYLFIEWAEKAESLIPDSCIRVYLEETGSTARLVKFSR